LESPGKQLSLRVIDKDLAKRALARGLITFSTEIGTAIVGEGIETAAELEALCGLGVEYGQGFFLGRPGPLVARRHPALPLRQSLEQ